MKFILGILILLAGVASSSAYDIQMTQGKDSYIFDFPDVGRTISAYQIDENEPYSDQMEGLMHDRFIMEDIFGATPQLQGHPLNYWMARSVGINNAFAAIRFGRRYIVLDPRWVQNHYARIFIIGHELGHHVCGHTAGVMQESPWAKELEADRFSGMIIRAMELAGHSTLQEALGNGMEMLSEQGSTSHPPRSMRIEAALDGYNGGSPCVGRQVADGGGATGGSYRVGSGPLWSHNGSVMRLIANGANRKFVYETPRAGLSEAGIHSGTVLFDGKKSGNFYSGSAYVYSRMCGGVGFQASGPVAPDQRSVTVYGKSPRVGTNCQMSGYRDDTLMFSFMGD